MFPSSYFPTRYYPARYFAKTGGVSVLVTVHRVSLRPVVRSVASQAVRRVSVKAAVRRQDAE